MNWMRRFLFTRTLALLAMVFGLGLWLWAPSARAALPIDQGADGAPVPACSATA